MESTSPPTPPVQPGVERHLWDYRWVRDLLIVLAALALVLLAYKVRAVTVPVLIALGLAYVFNPLVTWLGRRLRVPRWATTAVLMLAGLLALCGVIVAVVPQMINQTQGMVHTLRGFIERYWVHIGPYVSEFIAAKMGNGAAAEGAELATTTAPAADPTRAQTLQRVLDELAKLDFANISRVALSSLGVGASAVGEVISTVGYLLFAMVLIVICFFVFSWRFDRIAAWPQPLIPASMRERTLNVLGMMDRSVAAFVRGRLIQASVMGSILVVGWWIVGVPFWLVLGLLCAILNLIPYAAILGLLLALGLSLLNALGAGAEGDSAHAAATAQGFPWSVLVWPAIIYGVAQLLDGWVVEPLVQAKATNLGPLTILLAVVIGGSLAGLFGMLLAIPVAACSRILAQEVVLPRLRQYAQSR